MLNRDVCMLSRFLRGNQDAACVTVDVVNALHFLHNMGVSHRDLKASAPPARVRAPPLPNRVGASARVARGMQRGC